MEQSRAVTLALKREVKKKQQERNVAKGKRVFGKPLNILWKPIDGKFYPVRNFTSYDGTLALSFTKK
jgi:hypothetical protein